MKKLIKESGIRDIKNIAKRYEKAKIYFHQDLDGVTTAIAMKNYLEQNGIEVVDAEVIQYGSKEFAIKKPEGEGDIMPVLVDFAHGKPMFVIHTDHHDTQSGVEKDTATSFKSSRSNVETISQVISPKDIFPSDDIILISTVDSANFAVNKITPEMVMNFLYKFDKDSTLKQNKTLMGLVVNKLLLAYKNYPDFMEELVMKSKPSLLSILNNIKKLAKEKEYIDIDTMAQNQEKYIEKRSQEAEKVGKIISQYGLGSMKKGSYDRYVPFKNFPDADFLVTGFPMGMVQASCNPFKEDRELKGVNLGEIKDEVLDKFKSELENVKVTFGDIKKVAEQDAEYGSVGFTLKDMMAIYNDSPSLKIEGGKKLNEILDNISSRLYKNLSSKQKDMLEKIYVNGFDVIKANSGGHKCITNISGINFLYRKKHSSDIEGVEEELIPIASYVGDNRFINDIKSKLLKYGRLSDKQIKVALSQIEKEKIIDSESPKRRYVDLVKEIQQEFVNILNDKIKSQVNLKESNNVNKPFIFKRTGKLFDPPGMNIKYLTPHKKEIGFSNLLDFENAKELDYDIRRFFESKDKYCVEDICENDFFNSKNSLYLHDLRVHDEFQGNGYSKKLMNKCHKIADENGFKYVTLITNCDNEPAQNLYKKLGYILYMSDKEKDFFYKEL